MCYAIVNWTRGELLRSDDESDIVTFATLELAQEYIGATDDLVCYCSAVAVPLFIRESEGFEAMDWTAGSIPIGAGH